MIDVDVVHVKSIDAPLRRLRIAVLVRDRDPLSLAIYRDRLVAEFAHRAIDCVTFPERGPLPNSADIVWDPGLGMRPVPRVLRCATMPVVVTVHGLLGFALSPTEITAGLLDRLRLARTRRRIAASWRGFGTRVAHVVAVSPYGADEIHTTLAIPSARITAIGHGVDATTFRPDGPVAAPERRYFLMVAQYQPKKNVDRVLRAYATLPESTRPDLVAIVPGYPADRVAPPGVELIRDARPPAKLAEWYRGALALVAPSLHETFGMPLLEAMASGCPVITADRTACPQVTGDAARLVDPRSIDAIAGAMRELAADPELRTMLRARGLVRAARHTWQESAVRHRAVFDSVLAEARR